jgi:hypothetical protein
MALVQAFESTFPGELSRCFTSPAFTNAARDYPAYNGAAGTCPSPYRYVIPLGGCRVRRRLD